MKTLHLQFYLFLTTLSFLTGCFSSAENKVICNTPQNGKLGGIGIIICSFEEDITQIVWSYAEEGSEPLVRYDRGLLLDFGHGNNDYSMRIDGALLLIDAASQTGSQTYKVEVIDEDGHPYKEVVEYQFMGNPTTFSHSPGMYTTSPTTCSPTETTTVTTKALLSNGQSSNNGVTTKTEDHKDEHWKACFFIALVFAIIFLIGAIVFAIKCCKLRKKNQTLSKRLKDVPMDRQGNNSNERNELEQNPPEDRQGNNSNERNELEQNPPEEEILLVNPEGTEHNHSEHQRTS